LKYDSRSQSPNENVSDEQKIGDSNEKLLSYASACKKIKSKADTSKNEATLEDRIWYTLLLVLITYL
jgi:hypothetical protein